MLIQYRYLIKMKNETQLHVSFITETEEGHKTFVENLKNDERVEKVMREYVSSIDVSLLLKTEGIKNEENSSNS
ncbi:MAG: hypothetical protein J6C93_03285 [Clostridia bacterium]|nr:hypothetical protein [Clostridia bacterium]